MSSSEHESVMREMGLRFIMADVRKMLGFENTPKESFTVTHDTPDNSYIYNFTDYNEAITKYKELKGSAIGAYTTFCIDLA